MADSKQKPVRKVGVYDRPASADRSLARKLLPAIILLLIALVVWFLLLR